MTFRSISMNIIAFMMLGILFTTCNKSTIPDPYFVTRGVVLSVDEMEALHWPQRAKRAGLNTIGTHVTPSQVAAFLQSPKGEAFMQECARLGLGIEHELHAINDLLPRNLFEKDSLMFRMNEDGRRVADFNLCVHSAAALEIAGENAVKYARILKPTTSRYFYWIDDGRPMCHCHMCDRFSDSEQALMFENRILASLKKIDPNATLAHLAYLNTLEAPVKVKPDPGIFLEFAPIQRSWSDPLNARNAAVTRAQDLPAKTHGDILRLLEENLKVFGRENAQVLEYWIDVSQFSEWQRPAKKLPWNKRVFLSDLDTYARMGIKNVTSFGVYIDDSYFESHPDSTFIDEYGVGLTSYKPEQ